MRKMIHNLTHHRKYIILIACNLSIHNLTCDFLDLEYRMENLKLTLRCRVSIPNRVQEMDQPRMRAQILPTTLRMPHLIPQLGVEGAQTDQAQVLIQQLNLPALRIKALQHLC